MLCDAFVSWTAAEHPAKSHSIAALPRNTVFLIVFPVQRAVPTASRLSRVSGQGSTCSSCGSCSRVALSAGQDHTGYQPFSRHGGQDSPTAHPPCQWAHASPAAPSHPARADLGVPGTALLHGHLQLALDLKALVLAADPGWIPTGVPVCSLHPRAC